MTLIPLTRKNGKLYLESIGKFIKPEKTFPPRIIKQGIYQSKDNKEIIKELERDLIIEGNYDANAYEIGEEYEKDKAVHATGIYKIKNSIYRKVTGTNLIKEIIGNLLGDF